MGRGIPKVSKLSPGTFPVPFKFRPEISKILVEWKAPLNSIEVFCLKGSNSNSWICLTQPLEENGEELNCKFCPRSNSTQENPKYCSDHKDLQFDKC